MNVDSRSNRSAVFLDGETFAAKVSLFTLGRCHSSAEMTIVCFWSFDIGDFTSKILIEVFITD